MSKRIERYESQVGLGIDVPRSPRASVPPGSGFAGTGLLRAVESFAEPIVQAAREREAEQDTAYVAEAEGQVRRAAAEHFNKRKRELAGDPNGFAKSFAEDFKGLREQALEGAPSDAARKFLDQRLKGLGTEYFEAAGTYESSQMVAYRETSLDQSLDDLKRAAFADPGAAEDILKQGAEFITAAEVDFLSPSQAAEKRRAMKEAVAIAALKGTILEDPQLALQALAPDSEEPLLALISNENRLALASQAAGGVKDLQDAAEARQKEIETRAANARADYLADLELSISRGEAGYREIADFEQQWGFAPGKRGQRTNLVQAVDQQREKVREDQAAIQRVAGALAGSDFLDPRSEADRKAVDAYWQKVVVPDLAEDEPLAAQGKVVEFIERGGIVPPSLRGKLRGALRTGDPETKTATADLVARIRERRPAALDDFAKEDLAVAEQINLYRSWGYSAAQAVQNAEAAIFQAGDPARQERRERLGKDKLGSKASAAFVSEMAGGGLFSAGVKVPDALRDEFDTAFEAEFLRTGEPEVAARLARKDMRNTWAVTAVGGGRRWMKFAPEIFGPPQLGAADNAAWMQQQLIDEVSADSLFDPAKGDLEQRVIIAPDPETAREIGAGRVPSYQVFVLGDNGYEPLPDPEGGAYRWQPDWASSETGQRRKAEAKAELDSIMARARDARAGLPAKPGSAGGESAEEPAPPSPEAEPAPPAAGGLIAPAGAAEPPAPAPEPEPPAPAPEPEPIPPAPTASNARAAASQGGAKVRRLLFWASRAELEALAKSASGDLAQQAQAAMAARGGKADAIRFVGAIEPEMLNENARPGLVVRAQEALALLGLLDERDIDGKAGRKTLAALRRAKETG